MKITLNTAWHRFPKAKPGDTLNVDEATARDAVQRGIAVPADATARTAAETAQDKIDALEKKVQALEDENNKLAAKLNELTDAAAAAPAAPAGEDQSAPPAAEDTGKGKAKK